MKHWASNNLRKSCCWITWDHHNIYSTFFKLHGKEQKSLVLLEWPRSKVIRIMFFYPAEFLWLEHKQPWGPSAQSLTDLHNVAANEIFVYVDSVIKSGPKDYELKVLCWKPGVLVLCRTNVSMQVLLFSPRHYTVLRTSMLRALAPAAADCWHHKKCICPCINSSWTFSSLGLFLFPCTAYDVFCYFPYTPPTSHYFHVQ